MRQMLLIAALVASSGASAQIYRSNCRGETMSDLATCAAASVAPTATAPQAEPAAPLASGQVKPSALGGALQPSNLQAAPALVGRPATRVPAPGTPVRVVDPLATLSRDPTSPFYGLGAGSGRQVRGYDPLSGTGIGNFGMPNR